MAVAERKDPFLGYRFRVEIDGLAIGGFSEVAGLGLEIETEEYREGGVNEFVHKLPKMLKHPNVVLKHGLTDADELWKWQRNLAKRFDHIERRTIRIILLDSEGNEKISWRCLRAYPVKWNGPDFKADGSNVAVESLEVAHCGIERS